MHRMCEQGPKHRGDTSTRYKNRLLPVLTRPMGSPTSLGFSPRPRPCPLQQRRQNGYVEPGHAPFPGSRISAVVHD